MKQPDRNAVIKHAMALLRECGVIHHIGDADAFIFATDEDHLRTARGLRYKADELEAEKLHER